MGRSQGISKRMRKVDSGDAAYYHAHKDDVDEWGSTEPGPKAAQRLAVVVSVRFTADEEAKLRHESSKRRQTLSSFIRSSALAQCGTGSPSIIYLSYQTAPKTESLAFGGQISFPGGSFQLSGRPSAAEAPLPAR